MVVKKQTDILHPPGAPPPNGGRKRGLIILAVAAAVALAYGGYWSYLAGQVEAEIEQVAEEIGVAHGLVIAAHDP